jgi:DNA-binding transcriptional LysR family regulator
MIEIAELAEEPLLVLREGFGSRAWFDAACELAHIVPRLLLQSVVAQTIIELAATGYGIAIVPSTSRFPETEARVRPLVHRGESIGRWQMVAWASGALSRAACRAVRGRAPRLCAPHTSGPQLHAARAAASEAKEPDEPSAVLRIW